MTAPRRGCIIVAMLTPQLDVAVAAHAGRGGTPPAGGEPGVPGRGPRKAHGSHEAVRGGDLEIRRGGIVAVLGPNGAGKTTTVSILEGFLAADGGEVRVLGEDPWSAGRAWRDRVGVVLQESVPDAELTVREALAMHAGWYSGARDVGET